MMGPLWKMPSRLSAELSTNLFLSVHEDSTTTANSAKERLEHDDVFKLDKWRTKFHQLRSSNTREIHFDYGLLILTLPQKLCVKS
ncbi:unnamed protein product [Caenorhabditis auriculariae]|uniref:Uncharacterized protein n=1 Tax=Caenorhabditis auriculariae TaxID=2777116 RepID=A0A8S1HBE6_9PELO|nr:unnamed protein product [Caenorhabditis auriculariae]